MALLTLTGYWHDEVDSRQHALDDIAAQLAAARVGARDARTALLAASEEERRQSELIADLRRRLGAIPLPADAAPLLRDMNAALQAAARAREERARTDLDGQLAVARVARLEQCQQAMGAALAEAKAGQTEAKAREDVRLAMAERIASGDLKDLPDQVDQALGHAAAARAKVEAEFPANADVDPSTHEKTKDFLTRVRDRRGLPYDSAGRAGEVYAHARGLAETAVAVARADYLAAYDRLMHIGDAVARVAADQARLEALAGLAPPLITARESAVLKDATLKAAREGALALLCAADMAERDRRGKQAGYDTALATARKANPDATLAELLNDDAALKDRHDELAAAQDKLTQARDALMAASAVQDPETGATLTQVQLLEAWFAAVPDSLWERLESLDDAVAALNALKDAPPTQLRDALLAREDALVQALQTADLARRTQDTAADMLAEANAALAAERDTAARRARAMSHGAGAF